MVFRFTQSSSGLVSFSQYAWEEAVTAKIMRMRAKEMAMCQKILYTYAVNIWLMFSTPILVAGGTFLVYIALGHSLTVAEVYSVFAILNVLNFPLSVLPKAINGATQANVGLVRLQDFLAKAELPERELLGATGENETATNTTTSLIWQQQQQQQKQQQEEEECTEEIADWLKRRVGLEGSRLRVAEQQCVRHAVEEVCDLVVDQK